MLPPSSQTTGRTVPYPAVPDRRSRRWCCCNSDGSPRFTKKAARKASFIWPASAFHQGPRPLLADPRARSAARPGRIRRSTRGGADAILPTPSKTSRPCCAGWTGYFRLAAAKGIFEDLEGGCGENSLYPLAAMETSASTVRLAVPSPKSAEDSYQTAKTVTYGIHVQSRRSA